MLRAKVITTANIDDITEINGGVRPSRKTLNDNTFFVYDLWSDRPNEIIDRAEFHSRFDYTNDPVDNTIIEK
jgi:hypothetical protein